MHYQRNRLYGSTDDRPRRGKGVCSVDGCGRFVDARGFCSSHYSRFQRNGDPGGAEIGTKTPREGRLCAVDDCEKRVATKGWCRAHYENWRLRGDPFKPGPGRGPRPSMYAGVECSVEGCDYPAKTRGWCSTHYARWFIHGDPGPGHRLNLGTPGKVYVNPAGYPYVKHPRLKGRFIAQHRLVMEEMLGRELVKGENVHHRNGVKTDNRPENLELWVTHQPAGQNIEDLVAYWRESLARYEADAAALAAIHNKESA